MFEKFKSKYREYKYAKAHLKENPIESLSILMPKGMVLLAIISFIISLLSFTINNGFNHQMRGSISNDLFTTGTVGGMYHGFLRSVINLFLLINVVVIALKYYRETNGGKKTLFVVDNVVLLGTFLFYLLAQYASKSSAPVFIQMFMYKLFSSIPNLEVKVLGLMIIAGIIFSIIVYKSNNIDMIVRSLRAFLISYVILPVVLLVIENSIAIVKLIFFIVVFGIIVIAVGWGALSSFFSASEGESQPSSSSSKPKENKEKGAKKEMEEKKDGIYVSNVNRMLGMYLFRRTIDNVDYIVSYNLITERKLCKLEDYLSGKVHIYEKQTNREIGLNEIPWKK